MNMKHCTAAYGRHAQGLEHRKVPFVVRCSVLNSGLPRWTLCVALVSLGNLAHHGSLRAQGPDGYHPLIGYIHQGEVYAAARWEAPAFPLGICRQGHAGTSSDDVGRSTYHFSTEGFPLLPA